MLPGTQRVVVTPGKNEKRYLAGGYDPRHRGLIYLAGDRKARWLFVNLLRALVDACPNVRVIHVILDNYIIHKSRLTLAWMRERGVRLRLHFLPPYCPNANGIEGCGGTCMPTSPGTTRAGPCWNSCGLFTDTSPSGSSSWRSWPMRLDFRVAESGEGI